MNSEGEPHEDKARSSVIRSCKTRRQALVKGSRDVGDKGIVFSIRIRMSMVFHGILAQSRISMAHLKGYRLQGYPGSGIARRLYQ